MRLLLSVLALGFVCATSNANDSVSKSAQVLSEETVEVAGGIYKLRSVCISASNYSEIKAREFCLEDAATVNLLSTDRVMMNSTCGADTYPSRCPQINSSILTTRMSVF